MNNKITIETIDDKLNLSIEGQVAFPDLVQVLASVLRNMAFQTVDMVTERIQPPEKQLPTIRAEIASDLADIVNFAISNVLEELSPHDPDLQLSEIAIATMENEIIHKAAKEGKTIEQALKEYEKKLLESPYAASPTEFSKCLS